MKKNILLVLLLWLIVAIPNEAISNPDIKVKNNISYSLRSPFETIDMYLKYMEEENYNLFIAAQAFIQDGVTLEDAKIYASKLKEVLRNEGVALDLHHIPEDQNYIDPIDKKHKFKLSNSIPDIYLHKIDDKWVFTKESMKHINMLFQRITRFQKDLILKIFPKSFERKIFNVGLWQYILALAAVILSFIIYYIIHVLIIAIIKTVLKVKGFTLAMERYMKYFKSLNRSSIKSLIFFIWLMVLRPMLHLPVEINKFVVLFLKLMLAVNMSLFLYRLVDAVLFTIKRGVVEERFEFQIDLLPLLSKVLKVAITILSCLALLKVLNFDVSALLASLSLGSLGIALASQDTIKNLFGSVMIFIDKPFGVGDMIITKVSGQDIVGKVEEIGMRSTILKSPDQTMLYIPNALIANTFVDNKGSLTHGDFTNRFMVSSKTSIEQIEEFIDGFREIIDKHPQVLTGTSSVNLIGLRNGKFEIAYGLFFERSNYYKEMAYRHQVLSEVMKLAQKLDIEVS